MTAGPSRFAVFAADIKLSHTVFAMPFALLAMVVAAKGIPPVGVMALIVVCMVCARTVAMSANRLLDARLDAANPRTAGRAIPSGRLSIGFYATVVIACVIAFEAATAGFWLLYRNPWPILWSLPVLAFVAGYPLMKRFTRFCHYYLGAGLGLAPVCAWVATSGSIAWEPLIMAGAVLLWTAGFDILYACQDYQSDLQTGVVSVPAKLGIAASLWIARLTHCVSWLLLVLLWWVSPELQWIYASGVFVAAALLIYEHSLVKATDLSKLNVAFFTLNGIISVILGVTGILDVLF